MFPLIVPGGFFIMEDLDTSFEAHLKQAPFEGFSSISTFDYLVKLSRLVCGEQSMSTEMAYDLFINSHHAIVGSVEFGRRTAIISKKYMRGSGPI